MEPLPDNHEKTLNREQLKIVLALMGMDTDRIDFAAPVFVGFQRNPKWKGPKESRAGLPFPYRIAYSGQTE